MPEDDDDIDINFDLMLRAVKLHGHMERWREEWEKLDHDQVRRESME